MSSIWSGSTKNAKDPHIAATVASKKMVSSSDIVDSASKCLGSKPQEKNFPVDLPTESGVVAPQIPFAAAQKVTKNTVDGNQKSG